MEEKQKTSDAQKRATLKYKNKNKRKNINLEFYSNYDLYNRITSAAALKGCSAATFVKKTMQEYLDK